MNEKDHQGQLIRRLTGAAGVLLGNRMYDSHQAVLEAIEIIQALPFSNSINNSLYPETIYDPNKRA